MALRKGLYMLLLFLGSFPFTLKAQQPEPPTILQLDVFENGHVEIVYEYSITEGVDYYVIKRNHQEKNLVGTGDLDTIPPDISQRYLDNTARADTASYTYEMYSIKNDTSGNVTPEGSSTIFLKSVSYDTCANSVRLNWSPYIGWGENNPKYEIYINNTGLGFFIGDTSYQVRNVNPGETYQYHIRAKKSSSIGFFSHSNRVTLTIPELKKPDQLFITAVENTGTEYIFTTTVDPEADLSGHQLAYSPTAQGVYEVVQFIPKNTESSISFTQSATNPSGFYKVSAINSCNKPVDSTEAVRPLVLDYTQQDLDIVLHWDTTFIEGSETYDLFLSIDNSDFIKQETNWSGTSKNYTLDGSFGDANSELFCFYVVAHSALGQQSTSNTICLTRQPKVYLPTAFTPNGDGMNDFIKPDISFVIVEQYLFVVYDRYGGKVFETKNTEDKWWGRANNKNVSEGAYLYYLEFKTSQGVEHQQSGAINVVYP
jgi:gliding motility-associated-like protein